MSKTIDIRQRATARRVYGISLSKDCTEKQACNILKRVDKLQGITVWAGRLTGRRLK